MSIFKRLMSVDHRIIYALLALAIAWPLFFPLGLPVASEPPAEKLYDTLAAFPAGSAILFSADFSASGTTELKPMVKVLVDLCLQKGHRVVLMALWADGVNLMADWTADIWPKYNAVYGTNYIDLGYIPSYNAFHEASRTNFPAACNGGRDKLGNSLSSQPIMDGINKASDFSAVVTFGTGDPGYTHWYQNWFATGDVDCILAGQVAVNYPNALAAYNAGNLKGVAGGLGGAATLEKKHNAPGTAHGNSDAQSFGHLIIIVFVIVGNIGYFGARRAGEVK